MSEPRKVRPGQTVGIYQLIRRVGKGGMGEVWEAWEDGLRRRIAVKVLSEEALSNPEMVERFLGEGRALARLKHPNVVTLYTVGEDDGLRYMALEFIDGLPLDHFLMSRPCGLKDTIALFRQMVDGLAAAHEAGVIHRDLKPANIVVDQKLGAKLVDFGIAKVYSDHQSVHTAQDIVIGTTNYLAPEIVVGKIASVQSDIYSLGLVLYHMLTGEVPFNGRSNLETLEKIRTTSLAFSPRLQILLPEGLKFIVNKMTAKAPAMRYANARDILADLDKVSLENLPADLRESPQHGLPIANYTEIRKKCETRGFDTAEIRFIMNLAARLEYEREAPPDDEITDKILDESHMLKISDKVLHEAVHRFQSAKSTMFTRRQETKSSEIQIPIPPRRPRRSAPVLWIGVCLSVILGVLLNLKTISDFLQRRPSALRRLPASTAQFAVAPAKMPAPAAFSKTMAKSIPLMLPKVGDFFELAFTTAPGPVGEERIKFPLTVLEVKTDRVIWRGKGNSRFECLTNAVMPCLDSMDPEQGNSFNVIEGDPQGLFPLVKGKTVTQRVTGGFEDGHLSWNYTLRCTVGDEMQLQLKSGSYLAVVIDCMASGGPFEQATYYYSPLFGIAIRRDKQYVKNGIPYRETYELSSYSRAGSK